MNWGLFLTIIIQAVIAGIVFTFLTSLFLNVGLGFGVSRNNRTKIQ